MFQRDRLSPRPPRPQEGLMEANDSSVSLKPEPLMDPFFHLLRKNERVKNIQIQAALKIFKYSIVRLKTKADKCQSEFF